MEPSRITLPGAPCDPSPATPNSTTPPSGDPSFESVLNELRALRQDFQDLRRALVIHDELAQLALNGAPFSQIAAALAQFVGNPVLVENRFFRTLASAWPSGATPRDDRLPSVQSLARDQRLQTIWSRIQTERQPIVVSHAPERGIPQARVVAPVVVRDDVVGYVSIVGRDRPLGSTAPTLAQQACLAIGLEFVRQQAAFEAELRFRGNVLDVLLQCGEISPEVRATRSALLGYDCNAPQTLLLVAIDPPCAEATPPPDAPSLHDAATLVAGWARRISPGSLVTEKDGQIVASLAGKVGRSRPRPRTTDTNDAKQPSSPRSPDSHLDPVQTELTGALRREIQSFLPALSFSIAIAPPVPDSRELHHAYEIAHRALSILNFLGERDTVISTTDPRLAVFFLFDSTRPDTRQEFVDLVLGPLIAYDQRGRRTLVETLQAYLTCGGNLETTARTLNVHTSTLKYRLQRIVEVSGLDLRNADHRFNAALALKLRTIAGS